MMPTLSRAKVPLLYATNYEGGGCDRYLFCFNTVPNQELEKLLPKMKEIGGPSFYFFGADYIWPQKMFEAGEKIVAAAGGTVAGKEFTPWGVKDFAPVIRRIKESGAKVLVFALPRADGITFIRQAEDLGLLKDLKVAFLGFGNFTSVLSAKARRRTCGWRFPLRNPCKPIRSRSSWPTSRSLAGCYAGIAVCVHALCIATCCEGGLREVRHDRQRSAGQWT